MPASHKQPCTTQLRPVPCSLLNIKNEKRPWACHLRVQKCGDGSCGTHFCKTLRRSLPLPVPCFLYSCWRLESMALKVSVVSVSWMALSRPLLLASKHLSVFLTTRTVTIGLSMTRGQDVGLSPTCPHPRLTESHMPLPCPKMNLRNNSAAFPALLLRGLLSMHPCSLPTTATSDF